MNNSLTSSKDVNIYLTSVCGGNIDENIPRPSDKEFNELWNIVRKQYTEDEPNYSQRAIYLLTLYQPEKVANELMNKSNKIIERPGLFVSALAAIRDMENPGGNWKELIDLSLKHASPGIVRYGLYAAEKLKLIELIPSIKIIMEESNIEMVKTAAKQSLFTLSDLKGKS